MEQLKLTEETEHITFGQLYGMCDYLTFPLADAGYAAFKYKYYNVLRCDFCYDLLYRDFNSAIIDYCLRSAGIFRTGRFMRCCRIWGAARRRIAPRSPKRRRRSGC